MNKKDNKESGKNQGIGAANPMIVYTLVIDESISRSIGSRFESFLQSRNIRTGKMIFIAQKYSGIPDDRIIIHLLNQDTIFLTSDRPFHNKVLEKGLRSFYYDGEGFFSDRLKGIKTSERFHKNDLNINNSYQLPKTENCSLVMCLSDKQLEKLRTRRRRIRNHFGGLDHMQEAAVTISLISKGQKVIIGIKIRISSNIGIKALDATENYFEEIPALYPAGDIALTYALILPIQLMLSQLKTTVYYDSRCISNIINSCEGESKELFLLLKNAFRSIDFIPVNKGFHLERLGKKLANLCIIKSNEVVPGYFRKVMENYRSLL